MVFKRGQVWIETVLYTLIGLALIGMALGFIMPKINEVKDKVTVEQAINSLAEFDSKINEVIETGIGNKRQIEYYMKKGTFEINSGSYETTGYSEIIMTLDGLSKDYSQPGMNISMGRVKVRTEEGQKGYGVYLSVRYPNYNFSYGDKRLNTDKMFNPASTPYKFSIENMGGSEININEFSGQE